ncbi:MAG: sulfatase-like hydrolase/transferase [Planctomycetota bacterium]|nr:sulfatase-like hydrolase/transferase [Planctomycetota bacterium]
MSLPCYQPRVLSRQGQHMNGRQILFLCFFFTGSLPVSADDRPNVVLIMADDLGWMDLNCQGNKSLVTPNLNQLAAQGIRFTDAYSAAPVCSPTRAALMTGLAPARLHITNHLPDQKRFTPDQAKLNPAPCKDFLASEYKTLAEYLKSAGYATGFLGKWHLSDSAGQQGQGNASYYPENQGFDLNVGGCSYGGPPTFFDPYRIHNLPPRKTGDYLPDRLTDDSIEFISRVKDSGPFFLCLWNYTVHWPMEAPLKLLKKYEGKKGRGSKIPGMLP